MKLALTSCALTPHQLHILADAMETLGVEQVDIVPQITECKGQWFRVDGKALQRGRVIFEPETQDE